MRPRLALPLERVQSLELVLAVPPRLAAHQALALLLVSLPVEQQRSVLRRVRALSQELHKASHKRLEMRLEVVQSQVLDSRSVELLKRREVQLAHALWRVSERQQRRRQEMPAEAARYSEFSSMLTRRRTPVLRWARMDTSS